MSESLSVGVDAPVATITVNRPEHRNAFTLAMWTRLPQLLAALDADSAVRVIVVRGAGVEAFSAGGDIREFREVRGSRDAAAHYTVAAEAAEAALASTAKPTVALIHGWCVGGGCELAVACDFRWASASARFAIPQAKIGLLYGFAPTKRLVDLVGPAAARRILYTGEVLDAAEAHRLGLVDRIHPDDSLDEATSAFAGVLSQRAQLSIRGSKLAIAAVLAGQGASPAVDQLAEESCESADHQEGVRAFLERRPPRFG